MRHALPLLLAAALVALAGCSAETDEAGSIQPLPPEQETRESELGPPGIRPLSQGPGDKNSPVWSPSGDRVAFVRDGYVVDKPPHSPETHRWTTRDFAAEKVLWSASGEELFILAPEQSSGARSESSGSQAGEELSIYETRSGEGELGVRRLADEVLAAGQPPGGDPIVAASRTGEYESQISLLQQDGAAPSAYPETVEGRVTDLSVSQDGERALLGVRAPADGEGPDRFEVHTFDLSEGRAERVAQLESSLSLVGPPQEASDGIYYVAREAEETREGGAADGDGGDSGTQLTLYHLPGGSEDPEPVLGTGEDSVVFSFQVSPEGGRIALLGRRDSGSPTNLYTLDLDTDTVETVTVNENMDIRTGPENLSWSADGERVVLVARNDISAPEVYDGSAATLLADFYNLWEVPVADLEDEETGE
ncbi:MAG: PD40 domain-containing protein [Rubrobacter sp.]|nr:PD40 domain-containing protein [Rubrobacter sp.]